MENDRSRHKGRKPNTITSMIVKSYKELNDFDSNKIVDFDKLEEFPRNDESTIFVREGERKGKRLPLQTTKRQDHSRDRTHNQVHLGNKRTEVTVSKMPDCI